MDFSNRTYRCWPGRAGRREFRLTAGRSDLFVTCDCSLEAGGTAAHARAMDAVEVEALFTPGFLESLDPVASTAGHGVAARMASAARVWNVGPMAAVAGAIADEVGLRLLEAGARNVTVENGGDVFASMDGPVRFAVHPGPQSSFEDSFVFETDASGGVGICTSSGTLGHSLSLGMADAVTAVASDAATADAAATSIADRILSGDDVEDVIESERIRGELRALFAAAGGRAGFWGCIELVGVGEWR
jgi:ApbE superfamily uncharacterized protein (UPF0280 family)